MSLDAGTVLVARPLWPVLRRVVRPLASLGHRVEETAAWERLLDSTLHAGALCGVLLGDYGEVDGEIDVLRRFRALGNPAVPVVVVGGRSVLDRGDRFREAGADLVVPGDIPASGLLGLCLPLFRYARLYRSQVDANRDLRERSLRDGLTGLPDRRHFAIDTTRQLEFSRRTGRPLSCVIADIDDFKAINDRHGSFAGDEVIRRFGAVIDGAKRTYDTVARIGSDAFAWLLVDADRQEALRAAARVHAIVLQAGFGPGHAPIRLTATFGVSSVRPGVDVSADDLVGNADRALYWGKESGKNVIRFYPRERAQEHAAYDSRVS